MRSAIELCLFDAERRARARALAAARPHATTSGTATCPARGPGLVYGLRAHGPWRPERGHRFNPHKLLLDPYAREIVGRFEWRDEHFGADRAARPAHMDTRDNAPHALKARVRRRRAATGAATATRTCRSADTVIYELHVKGFTRLHPGRARGAARHLSPAWRTDAAIAHLRRLGVTAVEPAAGAPAPRRAAPASSMGLVNYWGYNTIGFFCPDAAPAPAADGGSRARRVPRAWSRALHAAGIEVILDVVYNHTAEGDEHGPTLSLARPRQRQLLPPAADDRSALRELHRLRQHARPAPPARAADGDGQPALLGRRDARRRLPLRPRRRCSAAATTASTAHARLLHRAARRTRCWRACKLIAEPWDIGPGGYQLGGFPAAGWSGTTASATPCAPSGSAATARAASSRSACAARRDLFQPRRPRAGRVGQLRRRARRLHAARPGQLRAAATTRPTARTTATATATT